MIHRNNGCGYTGETLKSVYPRFEKKDQHD